MSEYTFRPNNAPPDPAQAQTVRNMRYDARSDEFERWTVHHEGVHTYDLWLAKGSGNLLRANSTGLCIPCMKQGVWDHRGSDPSARTDRLVRALQRGWDRRG